MCLDLFTCQFNKIYVYNLCIKASIFKEILIGESILIYLWKFGGLINKIISFTRHLFKLNVGRNLNEYIYENLEFKITTIIRSEIGFTQPNQFKSKKGRACTNGPNLFLEAQTNLNPKGPLANRFKPKRPCFAVNGPSS